MLRVIGAGLGRTGTHSLAAALEILGLGPCYHMQTFSARPQDHAAWQAALRGEIVDWQPVFANFQASVEWPAVSFLPQVLEAFPQARVVLTLRDPQEWYASAAATIFRGLEISRYNPDPGRREQAGLARQIVLERFFAGLHWDRAAAITRFQRHNAEVRARVPAARLLAYRIHEGWEPLCTFLGLPQPQVAFPRLNARQDFLTSEPEWARRIGLDLRLDRDQPGKSD